MSQITDTLCVQLRAEFFNIFNHPNFALPNGSINPGFDQFGQPSCIPSQGCFDGQVSQTPDVAQGNPGLGGGGPRVIQLGVKFVF